MYFITIKIKIFSLKELKNTCTHTYSAIDRKPRLDDLQLLSETWRKFMQRPNVYARSQRGTRGLLSTQTSDSPSMVQGVLGTLEALSFWSHLYERGGIFLPILEPKKNIEQQIECRNQNENPAVLYQDRHEREKDGKYHSLNWILRI
jgi:hypothetical protein